jgi:predicted nucleotidyltransferase component of viral defense system
VPQPQSDHPPDRHGRYDGKADASPGRPLANPIPGVLDDAERIAVAERFGVPEEQVVRDHAISHALAAIANIGTDDVVFFGGTALSRTHLVEVRLSEDIDLITRGDRARSGDRIEAAISSQLRRTLGEVSFRPHIRDTRHPHPSVMEVGSTRIQIQLLSALGYPDWPTEIVDVEQRYSDAPPAKLRVLTPAGFVASKLAAWSQRGAPRDLYDLWALAEAGYVDAEAAKVFRRLGPYTDVSKVSFARLPTDRSWLDDLGHQCVTAVTPEEAAATVQHALEGL